MTSPFQKVAVVGVGLIGASWASLFLAKGLEVTVTDPAPEAEDALHAFVAQAWPALVQVAGAPASPPLGRLRFTQDLASAVRDADLVQENGPERLELKRDLFARLDALSSSHAILASSSSGLRIGDIQPACTAHPERTLIAHPFNPPHLMPLVELVGGPATSQGALGRAQVFYEALGKKVVTLRKEVIGHAANRIQAALFREVVHLVTTGVLSVEDADAAVRYGPGLRWSVMGQCMLYHLGGGDEGLDGFFEKFAPSIEAWWADLGQPTLDPETRAALIAGVQQEAGPRSSPELTALRDEMLLSRLQQDRLR